MKTKYLLTLALLASSSISVSAAPPVITKETRLDKKGKKVVYMFIDGIKVHETDPAKQPQPKVVTPKPYDAKAAKAPANAKILFDGTEKSYQNWTDKKGGPTKWKLVKGSLESVRRSGYIQSKEKFGSCRLHIEFATPSVVKGDGQGRGNSGVFLMGQYEVQVLDSYQNQTYPDGQCGALYGRAKPLVNASRKPGEWQTYDIICIREKKGADGKVIQPGSITVLHNGIVTHFSVQEGGRQSAGGLQLQDHGNPVRYRNIWARKLVVHAVKAPGK